MPLIVLALLFLISNEALAYPEFIGYKYSSCLTCHYNGHGNGPLNDYGRALWATEIAGRLFSGKRSEEQLGEASGFLGTRQLPWWIRPGVKTRQLYLKQSSGGAEQSRSILMQAEVNTAVFLQQDQSLALVASYGFAPTPNRLRGQADSPGVNEWISREHYARWQSSESMWWYIGMMDKVYGIRTVNHTAYSRTRTGLAMNDQAHGIVAHYIQPTWEFTANGFLGNLYQSSDLRQVGGSLLAEYEYTEAARVGASLLYSSNSYIGNQRFAVHLRRGYGFGSALLLETGLIRDEPKTGNSKTGYYVFSEALQKMVRGYHVFFSGQAYKDQLQGDRPDTIKASIGVLAFPMQRLELRVELENTRQLQNSPDVSAESWLMLGQVHLAM